MAKPRDREGVSPPSSKRADRTALQGPRSTRRPPRSCGKCGFSPLAEGATCPRCDASSRDDRTAIEGKARVASPERAAPSEEAVELGTTVDGRYRIESEIGRGGMGVVYLAKDTWLDRHVALKMIAPTWARNPAIVTSFQREAKALASIRSQFVVQVYAFGLHANSYFFAMEYVRGRSVKQILTEHRKLGETISTHRTLTILNRIAQGIDTVHAAGILHRDVKPSNIVIEEDTGRPVLVDFGLAVPGDDPDAALAIGTPQYMAPEQAGVGVPGATVTTRTDVYALAITAFEMLTGELPFDATDRTRLLRQHARKVAPLLSSRKPDLAPYDKTIARALAKDPAERYPSCTAFSEVLAASSERWLSTASPTLPPPPDSVGADSAPASVAVESVPGGRPTVALRPPAPAAPTAPAARAEPSSAATSLAGTTPSSPVGRWPTPATSTDTPRERPFHVLVVEDSPLFRKFTVHATQIAFFRRSKSRAVVVRGAASGKEAIELAAAQPPDFILLDFEMPGLDGVGTLSRLRELPNGHSSRVVVLSGRVSASDRMRFAVLGVNDYVKKPIDFRRLVDRIEGIAKRFEESEVSRTGSGR